MRALLDDRLSRLALERDSARLEPALASLPVADHPPPEPGAGDEDRDEGGVRQAERLAGLDHRRRNCGEGRESTGQRRTAAGVAAGRVERDREAEQKRGRVRDRRVRLVGEHDHAHAREQREQRRAPANRQGRREQERRDNAGLAVLDEARLADDLDQEQRADQARQQEVPMSRDRAPHRHVPTVARRPRSRHRS